MKPITLYDKVEKVVSSLYSCALESSADKDVMFCILIDVNLDGCTKPLLVVGTTHPLYGDGSCIAVLNPDKSLLTKIIPGVGYSNFILKEIVQGKCDLTLSLWINTNAGISTQRSTQYKYRRPSPARFSLLEI